MARTKATVLLKHVNGKTHKLVEVLAAEVVYAVYYNEKPFNLKHSHSLLDDKPIKYHKTAFPNSAPAYHLAERLNEMFFTDKFQVYQLTGGIKITKAKD